MTVVFHNKSCVQSAWESHMVNTSRFLNLQHVCSLSISRYLECQNRQTVGIYISLIMTRSSAIRKPESQKGKQIIPHVFVPLKLIPPFCSVLPTWHHTAINMIKTQHGRFHGFFAASLFNSCHGNGFVHFGFGLHAHMIKGNPFNMSSRWVQ